MRPRDRLILIVTWAFVIGSWAGYWAWPGPLATTPGWVLCAYAPRGTRC